MSEQEAGGSYRISADVRGRYALVTSSVQKGYIPARVKVTKRKVTFTLTQDEPIADYMEAYRVMENIATNDTVNKAKRAGKESAESPEDMVVLEILEPAAITVAAEQEGETDERAGEPGAGTTAA